MGLLLAIGVLLYAATFDHPFHLDSTYGIKDNPSIESLGNIPSFFWDPFTLTTLRSNADYRPVLQTTYAINYAISGRAMWSWHGVQILLHVFNAICLMRMTALLIPRMLVHHTKAHRAWIPFFVALVFVVHPTASGVVNYQWARSSLLTTAFLLPAILKFMNGKYGQAGLLYSLALFTKIEAVGCLGVFAAWLLLLESEKRAHSSEPRSILHDLRSGLNATNLRLMTPMLAVTALMAVIRFTLLPDFLAAARSDPSMTSSTYLMTQFTAWWHYIANWWYPTNLVADNLAYPIYDSFRTPQVFLAVYGWCLVGILAHGLYSRRPIYVFLMVAALSLIAPHSSFMPLTEMVNEHRPYLSLGMLSLCWMVPGAAGLLGFQLSSRIRQWLVALMGVSVITILCLTTVNRNSVFTSWSNYWSDTVEKAPSWRSHTNMGWHYLSQNRLDQAEEHFQAALAFNSTNPAILTNLAIIADRRDNHRKAKALHDVAVKEDHYTSLARENRAAHFLKVGAYEHALNDLHAAQAITRRPVWVHLQLTHALAGLGDWEQAADHVLRAKEIDEARADALITPAIAPFWSSEAQSKSGILFFKRLEENWPGRWWIHANLRRLAIRTGDHELAKTQGRLAEELNPLP